MARRGEIKDFTGIDDPYEPLQHPEITLDTVKCTPEENAYHVANFAHRRVLAQVIRASRF